MRKKSSINYSVSNFAVLILLFYSFGAFSQETVSWPFQRGPNRDGSANIKELKTDWSKGLDKIWEFDNLCEGDIAFSATMSSPVVSDGVLICVGRSQTAPP